MEGFTLPIPIIIEFGWCIRPGPLLLLPVVFLQVKAPVGTMNLQLTPHLMNLQMLQAMHWVTFISLIFMVVKFEWWIRIALFPLS
jgi:uncharacterized membrane protein (UPF0182 family)